MYQLDIVGSGGLVHKEYVQDAKFAKKVAEMTAEYRGSFDEVKEVRNDDGSLLSLWCYKGKNGFVRVQFNKMTQVKKLDNAEIWENNAEYVHYRWGWFDVREEDGTERPKKYLEFFREFPKDEYDLNDVMNYHEGGEEKMIREKYFGIGKTVVL